MSTIVVGPKIVVDTFSYSGSDDPNQYRYPVAIKYSQDLDGDGINEVIFGAFETQPNTPENFTDSKISIFGWENGKFKNLTSKFLPNGADLIEGAGAIAFGDFNGDNRVDMYVSGYSDMDMPVRSYQLLNQGSYFTKSALGSTVWEHDAITADINNDGFLDVLVAGYLNPAPYYLGSANGLVKGHGFNNSMNFGSSLAVDDFLGNGTLSMIVGDSSTGYKNDIVLLNINSYNNSQLYTTHISTLPTPKLETFSTRDGHNNSHDVRIVPFDFTGDGLKDAIVFSRAWWNGQEWPERSEIQFYENRGNGKFADVTESRLIGYNKNTGIAYTPVFKDLNHDGLTDIFLSTYTWGSVYDSTTILLQQKNGTFVDTGRLELSAAVQAVGGHATITFGPTGQLYMVASYPVVLPNTRDQRGNLVTGDNTTVELIPITFSGTTINVPEIGTVNNDNFVAKLGGQQINGNFGIDTVNYSGNKSEYLITVRENSKVTVVDTIAGRHHINDLSSIERLNFTNESVALDVGLGQNAGVAFRLYHAALNRNPDLEGLGYWLSALDNGAAVKQIAKNFVFSPEFTDNFYGDGSNQTFVTALYNNVLDRAPDAGGFDYWLTALNNGADRESILLNFSESLENYANTLELVGAGIVYDPWAGVA
jgi:hypothetical protein